MSVNFRRFIFIFVTLRFVSVIIHDIGNGRNVCLIREELEGVVGDRNVELSILCGKGRIVLVRMPSEVVEPFIRWLSRYIC